MKAFKYVWWALAIVPVVLLIIGYLFPSSFFASQEQIRLFIEPLGIWAPFGFILLQIVQVILAPMNHYMVGVAGGYLFGTFYGTLYNWFGRVIGSVIAYWIGRWLGRRILKHVAKKKAIGKYDHLFKKKMLLFLLYFLPTFPDDEISYLAGTSSLKFKHFFWIVFFGHISGSLALALAGSVVVWKDPLFIVISIITLIIGIYVVKNGFGKRSKEDKRTKQKS